MKQSPANTENETYKILKELTESDFFTKANLHIHTNKSDGKLTPQEVIENAQKDGLKVISITDHNAIDAYDEIFTGKIGDLNIVNGVEFDCWHEHYFIHVLGYGFDLNNKKIKNLCSTNYKERTADIIRFFTKRQAKDVIEAIKEAGGIAILAHPCSCWERKIEKLVKKLAKFGLDGLEVYYNYLGHRKIVNFSTIEKVKQVAIEYNMLMTGGTDCHGRELSQRK